LWATTSIPSGITPSSHAAAKHQVEAFISRPRLRLRAPGGWAHGAGADRLSAATFFRKLGAGDFMVKIGSFCQNQKYHL
jgi:hypothetical protein